MKEDFKMDKFYCIYACMEKDYHYGAPRDSHYNSREVAISDAREYCAGNDLVQVRGFINSNGNLDQVETIQVK